MPDPQQYSVSGAIKHVFAGIAAGFGVAIGLSAVLRMLKRRRSRPAPSDSPCGSPTSFADCTNCSSTAVGSESHFRTADTDQDQSTLENHPAMLQEATPVATDAQSLIPTDVDLTVSDSTSFPDPVEFVEEPEIPEIPLAAEYVSDSVVPPAASGPGEASEISPSIPCFAEGGAMEITTTSTDEPCIPCGSVPSQAHVSEDSTPASPELPLSISFSSFEDFRSPDDADDSDRNLGDSRPTVRRQRSAEPAKEFLAATVAATRLPSPYLFWNRAITAQILVPSRPGERAYLCVTPRILSGTLAEFGGETASPDEAESQFINAVLTAYHSQVLTQAGRLRILRGFDADGTPLCTGFLASSVLAAYRMQSDEDASGGAYYKRLADLLGCELSGGHPKGFDPEVFESLWVFLRRWLAEKTGAELAAPGDDVGIRRFVALPLTHVPLRRLDIEKLPQFFAWAGYESSARIKADRLLADLVHWVRAYDAFTAAGISALSDDRKSAVLIQVAHELEAWDGSATEPSGRRTASVEVMLDIVRYRPDLFYLPRRLVGFPAAFDDGLHIFEAGEDGWYDPVPVSPTGGDELAQGFTWDSVTPGLPLRLRRVGATVIPLTPSPDYTGFVSRGKLLRGAASAVLCEERLAGVTGDYLGAVSGRVCAPITHSNVPAGWRLFTNVTPKATAEVPAGLENLEIDSQVEVLCSGGLRLGRRRAWLAGAPPQIIVAGLESEQRVTLDGRLVKVDEAGLLQTNGCLSVPGIHVIEVGRLQRTVEIAEPQLRIHEFADGLTSDMLQVCVPLPRGSWTVIGASPDEVVRVIATNGAGTLWRQRFRAVWAIAVGAGRGAIVISLGDHPLPPVVDHHALVSAVPWASVIYDAAIRRPHILSLTPSTDRNLTVTVWRQYMSAARQVKRQRRRSQR